MGKETGIFLSLAFLSYALLDILFFKRDRKSSFIHFGINSSIFFGYYFFIRNIMHGYSERYISSFNIDTIIANMIRAPGIIKLLFCFGALWTMLIVLLRLFNKRIYIQDCAVLFPLSFVTYLIILLPWGFPNYLLAPLAPLISGMLYPLYAFIARLHRRVKLAEHSFLVVFSLMVVFFIIIPRISKTADIRKIMEYIYNMGKKDLSIVYFFPPPFSESAEALKNFTGMEIVYLEDGVLTSEMLIGQSGNYLIFGDECGRITLENVGVEEEVYRNNTWRLFVVKERPDNKLDFCIDFPKNLLQRIKDRLREL
jgi:hypothetical protein